MMDAGTATARGVARPRRDAKEGGQNFDKGPGRRVRPPGLEKSAESHFDLTQFLVRSESGLVLPLRFVPWFSRMTVEGNIKERER